MRAFSPTNQQIPVKHEHEKGLFWIPDVAIQDGIYRIERTFGRRDKEIIVEEGDKWVKKKIPSSGGVSNVFLGAKDGSINFGRTIPQMRREIRDYDQEIRDHVRKFGEHKNDGELRFLRRLRGKWEKRLHTAQKMMEKKKR